MNNFTKPEKLGKYQIKSLLGEGAMGMVFQAHDPDINRQVAIKVLHPHLLATEEGKVFKKRFRREAQAAARCVHPNIVTVFELGHEDDLEFIVMEYVQGEELKYFLDSKTHFSIEQSLLIIIGVLKALSAAHGQEVVHRDVKPGNIILLDDGSVKLSDFGVAQIEYSDLTMRGHMVGTPTYMSPEGLRGKQVDFRADIYSAGVVLLELLTGQRPVIEKLLKHPVKLLVDEIFASQEGLLSKTLRQIIYKALAEEKSERFGSADEFIDAIQASYNDEPDVDTITEQLSKTVMHLQPLIHHKPQSVSAWDKGLLSEIERIYAAYLGPMAGRLVNKYASNTSAIDDLVVSLADHIEDQAEKEAFTSQATPLFSKAISVQVEESHSLNATLSREFVELISHKLAFHIGPIAQKFVVHKAKQTTNIDMLFEELAKHVPEGIERAEFIDDIRNIELASGGNQSGSETGNKRSLSEAKPQLALQQQSINNYPVTKEEIDQAKTIQGIQAEKPEQAIEHISREQVTILEFMMRSLEAVKESGDITQANQIYQASGTLCETIDDVIKSLLRNAELSTANYEYLNVLSDSQQQLRLMNDTMKKLASELKYLVSREITQQLSISAIEGLGAILLTLIDLAKDYTAEDQVLLRRMTSRDEKGLASIRKKYLENDIGLDGESRSILFSSTTHIEQLKSMIGAIGDNYRKFEALV